LGGFLDIIRVVALISMIFRCPALFVSADDLKAKIQPSKATIFQTFLVSDIQTPLFTIHAIFFVKAAVDIQTVVVVNTAMVIPVRNTLWVEL
jgi:hypothetical protein